MTWETPVDRSSHSTRLVLVGRDQERATLNHVFHRVRHGTGRLVLVSGDAGIAKTTLVEAVASDTAADGARVLVAPSYDLTDTPPFGPWRTLLSNASRTLGASPVPTFEAAFDVDATSTLASRVADVRVFLERAATEHPLLLIFEDIHWSDAASLELLREIARNIADLPIMIVATYRPLRLGADSYVARMLPLLQRESDVVRISLRPLPPESVADLIRTRYKLLPPDEDRLIGYLQAHAEGNPFFINELLDALADERQVRNDASGTVVGDLSQLVMPPALRDMVARRIDRLPPSARPLLSIAAIIGHEVPFDLWARVSETDELLLLDVIEEAVAERLLDESPDGSSVRFTHALIHDALYAGTLATRRRRWHRSIAEALIDAPRADPDTVASHLRLAGDGRAVDWLVRAGDAAQRSFADLTAASRYEDALAMLATDDNRFELRCELLLRLGRLYRRTDPPRSARNLEEAARLATRADDAALAAVATFRRGWVQCYAGSRRDGLRNMEQGLTALDALPPSALTRLEMIDHVCASQAARCGSYALRLIEVGRYDDARRYANAALADESTSLLDAHDARLALAGVARAKGRPDEARRLDAETYEHDRRTDDHDGAVWIAANELVWAVLSFWTDDRGWLSRLAHEIESRRPDVGEVFSELPLRLMHLPLLYLRGDWNEARSVAVAARQTRLSGHAFTQVIPLVLGNLLVAQGDHQAAWELVRTELPGGPETEPGACRFLTGLATQRTAAATALGIGDYHLARQWLEAHDRWLAWGETALGMAEARILWARLWQARGDLTTARAHAERAGECALRPRQPLALLDAQRLLAGLHIAEGRHQSAEPLLAAAFELADACHAPYERALTLLARAELHIAKRDFGRAANALDTARSMLMPLHAQPAIHRANHLASVLAAAQPGRFPAGLTEREVAVLRLLAGGQSNRKIAQQLGITTRTAERHVSNLYLKIDAHGRADATTFAIRHHLLDDTNETT